MVGVVKLTELHSSYSQSTFEHICIPTRSPSLILSNSSMHTMPLSANTIAPASSRFSPVGAARLHPLALAYHAGACHSNIPVSMSVKTAAVNPTPEEPRPVVAMASGAMLSTKRSICDLAVEGSPTISTLMSLRRKRPV